MTKKLLLLCLTALFSTATWAYDKSVEVNGVTFYFNIPLDNDDKPTMTLMVTHKAANDKSWSSGGADTYSGEIEVPGTVELTTWSDSNFSYEGGTYTVVGIDSLAFAGTTGYDSSKGGQYNTSTLTKVTLPSTITTIKGESFERTAITEITIPSSVTFLGDYVFNSCEELTSVTFEEGIALSAIPTMAFLGNTSLTSIALPESVTSIGTEAFENCTALASVSLPTNLWKIDKLVFHSCTELTTIEIPAGCTTIEDSAFEGCTALTAFTVAEGSSSFSASDDGVLFNSDKTTLVFFPEGSDATTYEIPETVKTIAGYAFYDCDKLLTVTIPEGVTTIDEYAFSQCTSLTEVVIPNSVTSLGQYAFNNCNKATTLTIGTGLTTISNYAFQLMSSLTEVVVPDNVTTIGNNAFYRCDGLTKIVLGSGVSSLGNYAFQYGNSTSSHGTDLTAVYSYHSTAPTVGTSVFRYRDLSYAILYVPEGSSTSYSSSWTGSNLGAYNNNNFSSIVELGNVEVGTIFKYEPTGEYSTLWYKTTSESTCQIIMPQNEETYRFNWYEYTYLTIPEYAEYAGEKFLVTRIDDDAFNGALTFGSKNTYYCDIQGPVTIPANITSIGARAFAGNSDLASSITFEDGTGNLVLENTDDDGVEGRIFHNSNNGGTVYLGRDIVLSGSAAVCSPFYNDAACTNITVGHQVTAVPDSLFVRTSNAAANIDFSGATSLTTIGDHAFALQDTQSQSSSTTTITIPATVTYIGDGAFYGMKSVSEVTLQSANVTVGGPSVFGDASQKRANAVNLHVPADNLSDYEASDWGSVYYVAWADEEEAELGTIALNGVYTTAGGTTYYCATYYNGQYQIKLDGDGNWFANVVEDLEIDDGNAVINDGTVDEVDYLIAGNAVLIECKADNYAETGIVLTGQRANATPFIASYSNILYGSDEETQTSVDGVTDGYYFYMLSYDKNGENLGFYWGAENGAPFQSAANKAWMAVDASTANFSKISFKNGGDDTTGISSIETNVEGATNGAIYTIQGVRVNDMTQPGIYIQNGKKVLVK